MEPKFFSIIPARIGSKGIIKKNLYPFKNKPLVQWAIEASVKSKFIKKTIVSSDSDEILNLKSDLNFTKHKRGKKLSNDKATSQVVVENILEEMEDLISDFEYLVLLQPTSPLRSSDHIDKACKKILEDKANSLISVKEISNSFLKILIENPEGGLMSGQNNDFPFMPRQKLPKAFMPNGAIYISKISSFIEEKSFLAENNSYILMDKQSSLDIDTIEDVRRAESFF
jgi:CMP-N-acetylneuraminic acid synthetase